MAFWRMHVNAWLRSDLSLREYSEVHEIGRNKLMRWRRAVKQEDMLIERKAMRRGLRRRKTKRRDATGDASAVPLVEAKSGRRRHFAGDIKRRIVEETCQPGMSVSEVARRYNLAPNIVFRWRGELGLGPQKAEAAFAPVQVLALDGDQALAVETVPAEMTDEASRTGVEIRLLSGQSVRFDRTVAPDTIRRIVLALEDGP